MGKEIEGQVPMAELPVCPHCAKGPFMPVALSLQGPMPLTIIMCGTPSENYEKGCRRVINTFPTPQRNPSAEEIMQGLRRQADNGGKNRVQVASSLGPVLARIPTPTRGRKG